MSTKKEHLDFIALKGNFVVDCSHAIFSTEEIEILQKYGHWFSALTSGDLQPITDLQKEFVLVVTHQKEPFSIEETAWYKYLGRKAYESKCGDKYYLMSYHYEEDTFYSREMVKQVKSTMFKITRENHQKL